MMNPKIDVRSGAIACALMAMAMLTALVTKAAAAGQQRGTPVIEIAQASQLPSFQRPYVSPGYVPQQPNQGGADQTLTLPQAAPQTSPPPAMVPPRLKGQEGTLEVPTTERQPQTTVGRIQVTATDNTGRWIQDLRKDDLTLYEDGMQRPVLGLQRDNDTPVSLGIVVDTSGSMSWKLPAAKSACSTSFGA
jgi:hypothetical protein